MKFSDKTAVIVSHIAMFGPPHELRDYLLKNHIHQLLFIGHPNRAMHNNHIKSSFYEYYVDGKLVDTHKTPEWHLSEYVGYVKDFFLTLIWSMTNICGKTDCFIGLGNINAFAGLIIRATGYTKSVYYYVIDYIPHRFSNRCINWLYHLIDMASARYATKTWNYAKAMIVEREKHWKRLFPNQIIVPNGIHIRMALIPKFEDVHRHELIYIGSLSKQQGIQTVLDAIPLIKKKIPDIHFTLIGKGNYGATLEKQVRQLKILKEVTFLGYIDDPVEADKRIGRGSLGVAMYDPALSFVIYTEPGKVKRYLSLGVPVVMTDISPLGKEMEKHKCGYVCAYDKNIFAKTVVNFLMNEDTMRKYRTNALRFVRHSTWDKIFTDAFTSIPAIH